MSLTIRRNNSSRRERETSICGRWKVFQDWTNRKQRQTPKINWDGLFSTLKETFIGPISEEIDASVPTIGTKEEMMESFHWFPWNISSMISRRNRLNTSRCSSSMIDLFPLVKGFAPFHWRDFIRRVTNKDNQFISVSICNSLSMKEILCHFFRRVSFFIFLPMWTKWSFSRVVCEVRKVFQCSSLTNSPVKSRERNHSFTYFLSCFECLTRRMWGRTRSNEDLSANADFFDFSLDNGKEKNSSLNWPETCPILAKLNFKQTNLLQRETRDNRKTFLHWSVDKSMHWWNSPK